MDLPFMNGDAGLMLGTVDDSTPKILGKANFDLGIIAGTKSINWVLSLLTSSLDDGKVSIKNTKIEGMSQHIEMPVNHTFIMQNEHVIDQIVHYVKHGNVTTNQT
jgi:hypothetical protein